MVCQVQMEAEPGAFLDNFETCRKKGKRRQKLNKLLEELIRFEKKLFVGLVVQS
jgi:hypothetical protein